MINFLIYSNFGYQEQKQMNVSLTVYKLIVEESSLVLPFKSFAKNEAPKSDM